MRTTILHGVLLALCVGWVHADCYAHDGMFFLVQYVRTEMELANVHAMKRRPSKELSCFP